ncbi:MAG: hypothetical protein M1814_000504 [Vezdaea aestivalis]|nr:MAG: hypothetical protein M1814_000504 [Vezdaea aestivalis]
MEFLKSHIKSFQLRSGQGSSLIYTALPDHLLPTPEEIAGGKTLKSNGVCTVVQVKGFAVKYGRGINISEAENMRFVAAQTTIRVPEVFGAYTRDDITYIVMELIPGETLETAWPTMGDSEKLEAARRLRAYLKQLRRVKSSFFGGLGCQPYEHGVFRLAAGQKGGPFHSESSLVNAILRAAGGDTPSFTRLQQLSGCLHGHEAIFTHGDIQRKNVMFERVGKSAFKLTIIDWEVSGFFPSWWEYDSAMEPRPLDEDWNILIFLNLLLDAQLYHCDLI